MLRLLDGASPLSDFVRVEVWHPIARLRKPRVVVPLELRADTGVLTFFSTTTVFGTALDITLSELGLEQFSPPTPRRAKRCAT